MSEKKVTIIEPLESTPAIIDMHPMVAFAMQNGEISAESLDKLLQVQKDWEANEARKAYAKAMASFRSEVPSISKDSTVDFTSAKGRTNYRYETLDGIFRTIATALSNAGLAPTYDTKQENQNITVTCRVTHALGHFEETSMTSGADCSGNKNNIQALGSTVTYLQRYTLKALLGLSAGVDNDANNEETAIEYINKEQQKEIYSMCEKNSIEISILEKYLKSKKIMSIEEIQTWVYPKVIEKINEAISK